MPRDIRTGLNARVTKFAHKGRCPPTAQRNCARRLRAYERLAAEAGPELAAVYAAEITAVRAMLARIEAAAASGAGPAVDHGTGLQGNPTAAAATRKPEQPN